MCTTTQNEILKLLPIDWQALSAIATFLVVLVSFLTLRFYRKKEEKIEKREIFEKIIEPLKKKLSRNVGALEDNPFSMEKLGWNDIKKECFLVYKLPPKLKMEIENLETQIEKFCNLSRSLQPKLIGCFLTSILNSISKTYYKLPLEDFEEDKEEILHDLVSYIELLSSGYSCEIGGKYCFITFWKLLLTQKDLNDYLEEIKTLPEIVRKEITKEQFMINDLEKILKNLALVQDAEQIEIIENLLKTSPYQKEIFNKVFDLFKMAIEKDKDLSEYIRNFRETYRFTKDVENFLK